MAQYPALLGTFTTKVNHIDVYDAENINTPQNEIIALQTYIGTNPHGTKNSFADRVNVLLNGSGVVVNSNAFPADTTPMRLFYRQDSETLFVRRFDNSAWQAVGQTQSNTVFSWVGKDDTIGQPAATAAGLFIGTGVSLTAVISSTLPNMYYVTGTTKSTYPLIATKFSKVQGVTTLKFYTKVWSNDGAAVMPLLNIGLGTLIATGGGISSTAPTWTNSSIDISALVNGTVYDMTVAISNDGTTQGRLSSVIIFGA